MTASHPAAQAVLEISSASKQYGALRPLRIQEFRLGREDRVALIGFDQPAAEVLINLLTGASLPDAGTVHVFGRSTVDIADSADWLSTLDRFGIVSDRAPLIDALSIVQNLSVPFSLEIEPPPAEIREQAVRLAGEAGLAGELWDRPVGELTPAQRVRVRIARSLALNPAILLLEHSSATLDRRDVAVMGRDMLRIIERRGAASIALTMDQEFAAAVASRILTLDPATGRLTESRSSGLKFWS